MIFVHVQLFVLKATHVRLYSYVCSDAVNIFILFYFFSFRISEGKLIHPNFIK